MWASFWPECGFTFLKNINIVQKYQRNTRKPEKEYGWSKPNKSFKLTVLNSKQIEITMPCQTASTNAQQVRCVRSGTESNVEKSRESVSNGFNISRTKEMLRQSLNEIKLKNLSTLLIVGVKQPQHLLSTNVVTV